MSDIPVGNTQAEQVPDENIPVSADDPRPAQSAMEGNEPAEQKTWKRIPVAQALEMRNEDGSYKYGKLLSQKQRFQLIKAARAADAKRSADAVEALENELLTGAEIPREKVAKMFENRPDLVKYQNDAINVYDTVMAKRGQEERSGARFQSFLRNEEEKAAKKKQDAKDNAFRCALLEFKFSPYESKRNVQAEEWRASIIAQTAGDPTRRKTMLGDLDSMLQSFVKDDSYKKSAVYQQTFAALDAMKNEFDSYKKAGDLTRSGDDAVKNANFKMVTVKTDEFFRVHPDATIEQAKQFVAGMKELVMQNQVSDLEATLMRITPDGIKPIGYRPQKKKTTPAERKTGTLNGKKVVFENGKLYYAK